MPFSTVVTHQFHGLLPFLSEFLILSVGKADKSHLLHPQRLQQPLYCLILAPRATQGATTVVYTVVIPLLVFLIHSSPSINLCAGRDKYFPLITLLYPMDTFPQL